jgi:predicted dehydrogenase
VSSNRNAQLQIGVVGGGLVAQAMHLPYLTELAGRFRIAGLAEPSRTVREALAARFPIDATHADWRSLVDAGSLDALLVAAPAGLHVEIVLAALDAGLHVFCEKPLCIDAKDVDRIVAARDRAGRVVQVGYMKRHDPAFRKMLAELPPTAEGIRYISMVNNDPEWVPYFQPGDIVRGDDIPAEVIEAARRAESEQVEAAVGRGDPEAVSTFSEGYLGSLIHQVNVVHGLLERMGEPLPARIVDAAWWHGGKGLAGYQVLANGARWDSAWLQLFDTREYREWIALYFTDGVRSLTFPSPWLKMSPTVYERQGADGFALAETRFLGYEESFRRELEHFHDCCVGGAECLTPPEQARIDTVALTEMFLASLRVS